MNFFLRGRLPTVAVIGPPGCGKSTLIRELEQEFSSSALFVPETMTVMKQSMGLHLPLTDQDLNVQFIRGLSMMTRGREVAADAHARHTDRRVVVFDRGIHCSAGYDPLTVDLLMAMLNLTESEAYGFYDLVIYLTLPPQEVWDRISGNTMRDESEYDEAARIHKGSLEAWRRHPRFNFIKNGSSWDEKSSAARVVFRSFLKEVSPPG